MTFGTEITKAQATYYLCGVVCLESPCKNTLKFLKKSMFPYACFHLHCLSDKKLMAKILTVNSTNVL